MLSLVTLTTNFLLTVSNNNMFSIRPLVSTLNGLDTALNAIVACAMFHDCIPVCMYCFEQKRVEGILLNYYCTVLPLPVSAK